MIGASVGNHADRYLFQRFGCLALKTNILCVKVTHYTDNAHVLVNLHVSEFLQLVDNSIKVGCIVDRYTYTYLRCGNHVDRSSV